ncbi:MAG: matrixin family metalloprotease [Kofleriaceae bacterium]
MRYTSLITFAMLVGCGGGGDTTIDIVHDVCSPPTLSSPLATAVQAAGIDASTALWRARGAPALGVSPSSEPPLQIEFMKAAGPFWGQYDDESGVIFINDAIADVDVLSIVIAHELGHAFGLEHVKRDDRTSLMNPANTVTPPTEADQRELERLWGPCQ